MADKLALQSRRRARLRYQLKIKSGGRPRLSVFRSGKHIYAQVIDDRQGRTRRRRVDASRSRCARG